MERGFFPTSTMIELHVPDFDVALKFYTKLGFIEIWRQQPQGHKGYMVLRREQNVLCFWGGNEEIYNQNYFSRWPKDTPRGYGVEIVLCCSKLLELYDAVRNEPWIVEPLKQKPWGLEDFRIQDPFGFYLRLTHNHDIRKPSFIVS